MNMTKFLLKLGPFLIILLLLGWIYFLRSGDEDKESIITRTTVLNKVEALGKMELVKYHFKEVTEITEMSEKYFNFFKLGPDSKIALISTGYAVGCLDLSLLSEEDIRIEEQTIYINLPKPELCYYKLDLEKTRIFSLQTNPLKDESAFIQKAYKNAEEEIKVSALSSGIMNQTLQNAELVLRPLLENLSGKTVVFVKQEKLNSPL